MWLSGNITSNTRDITACCARDLIVCSTVSVTPTICCRSAWRPLMAEAVSGSFSTLWLRMISIRTACSPNRSPMLAW